MFQEIFFFELKYRFRRPATYAYFGILFLFLLLVTVYGNGPASEKTNVNSPLAIARFLSVITIFGTLMASAIMGVPVFRDIEHGTKDYFFSYPVTEKGYLLGRYLGSFITLLFVMMGACLGIAVGSALGPLLGLSDHPERFGPFVLWHYLQPMLVIVLPTMFFVGSIFFGLVALTRKVFVTYVGSIVLFIGYLVASALMQDMEQRNLASILDPFANRTVDDMTRYWTPPEQNTLTVPFTGNLLWNRLLWGGIGLLVLLYTLFRFDFQRFLAVKLGKKRRDEATVKATRPLSLLPVPKKVYTTAAHVNHLFRLARLEFFNIVKDPYFLAILLGGFLFLFFDGWFGSPTFGTPALPLTYYMLEVKDFNYILFVYIILIFYTGEAVHRDKSVRYDSIADALPVPNWLGYGSKFLALLGVCFLLVNLVWVSGIINQTIKGYFNYEFGMYFKDLYLIELPEYVQLAMLTFFVHILVNNKFLGHIISIAVWMVLFGVRNFGEQDYNLFFYSYTPGYRISDLNGFGHFWKPLLSFNLYWLLLGGILLVLGNLLWNRGAESSFKTRLSLARQRFNTPAAVLLTLLTLGWLGTGFYIYHNVSVQNIYRTAEESRRLQADQEKLYKKYERIAQPKVTDLKVAVDLYPSQRYVEASGVFILKNKSPKPIDSLHLNVGSAMTHFKIKSLSIDGVIPKLVHNDTLFRYYIYQLPKTLQPGDSVSMTIATRSENRGFENNGFSREVVYNGSFLNGSDLFPSFGYNAGGEMNSDKYRKKYGLPKKDYSAPKQTDAFGLSNLLFNDDADLVTFAGTVSTEPDQIAILPGYLQKDWVQKGKDGQPRRYFSYKQEGLMDLFFNVSSARYAVTKEAYKTPDGQNLAIEIYHHPSHTRNVGRYVQSVKDAVAYNNLNYRPYQYKLLRILEFPRYAGFAQSFPNTVPYTESFGWVADFSDPNKTDYAYYVTAHEVAHQWWGHQVCPSNTRGANQISESMAEYSSLMVLKHKYGEDVMQNRLKYCLDRYLGGRANEDKFEETLLENDSRAYVWYDKGSLVLYALQDMMGEKALNKAFSDFANKNAFLQKPPFPTSGKWVSTIRAAVPDSLQYFVEDAFEKISLYENRITKAEATPGKGDAYEVKLTVQTKKLYYDKKGNETSQGKGKDLIEIGIFTEDKKNSAGQTRKVPLYLKKHWLSPGEHVLSFAVKGKPLRAGIDPYNKLIDRISDDNVISVE